MEVDIAEDVGLYDDLNYVDLGELVGKLENDKETLSKQIKTLEGNVESLASELTSMKETEKSLSRNISELYKTAKNEIERKDRMITELRAEKDNMLFRRINRATEDKQPDTHVNVKRIKQEVFDEHPTKRKRSENEPVVVKSDPGRRSPRRRYSSDSRDHRDRHSTYSRDNHRHRDSGSGSSRRNHANEGSDRNRRYYTKGEDSERSIDHKNESKQSSDSNKFKHNSITKQDLTKHTKESSRGNERGRNENTGTSDGQDFRKHESESFVSDRKRKYESTLKSTIEKENDRSKVNGPTHNSNTSQQSTIHTNSRIPSDDLSGKPVDRDSLPHVKNHPKGEDKSSSDRKKKEKTTMKPFSFFDETLSPVKNKNLVNLAQHSNDQLNSKTVTEPKGENIGSTEKTSTVDEINLEQQIKCDANSSKEQKIRLKDGSAEENENLFSPRHDNLMNYLEIQPKRQNGIEKSMTSVKDDKLVLIGDSDKKLKSKTSSKEKSGSSKEEKSKSKTEKTSKRPETKKFADERKQSQKQSKTGSNSDKTTTKHNKDSVRKHKHREGKVNKAEESENHEDSFEIHSLCETRERLKRYLENHFSSDEDIDSTAETLSVETDDAQVTFLANVHISPVIKTKKGATHRLQECIVKLGERENSAKNSQEENHNIVPTKNENSMEVTSSYIDDPIGSPTSSSNQIITKRTPRLASLINKLSGKEPNSSRYEVFAEKANEVAHSTLNINDCQLSSTNTTIIEENTFNQPGTSAINDSNSVLTKLPTVNNEIITNQPGTSGSATVKPQLPSTETTESNSKNDSTVVNLIKPLETSTATTIETNTTNNNNAVLENSKTDSVDPNISSSSEHLNSNSTIVLNSNLSLNNSSENGSSVRTVFNNRRRRCVVKIVN